MALGFAAQTGHARANELTDLLAQSNCPARFAGNTANFSAAAMDFTFSKPDAADPTKSVKEQKSLWVIKDGARFVALYDPGMGQLDMISWDPNTAPAELHMPTRYHWGSMLGARVQTVPWDFGWGPTGDVRDFKFDAGGKTLTLVESQKWNKRGSSEHRVTLSLDPACGYRLDMDDTDSVANNGKFPNGAELCNLVPGGLSNPWTGTPKYQYLAYTPRDTAGVASFACNQATAELTNHQNVHFSIRDGGYLAWVGGADHWGLGMTHDGANFNNVTCNVWQDQHNQVVFPAAAVDGMHTVHVKFSVFAIPPEADEKIMSQMKLRDWNGRKEVFIPMGQLVDFENNLLPVTHPIKAVWSEGLAISTDQAHSGKSSLVINGVAAAKANGDTFLLHAPQIPLEASTAYHLQCWVKAVGDVKASIAANLYLDDHFNMGNYVHQQTPEVAAGDWQKVDLTFTTPEYGPFLDLRFKAIGSGKAYFDDFIFEKVAPQQNASASTATPERQGPVSR